MDAEGLTALLRPEGWSLLSSLPPYEEAAALTQAEQLRRAGHQPHLIAAALTQSRLRAQATKKFGPFADGMLFTSTGLEQATRLPVAARHADRFVTAGITTVADLGCGIGGDAMAFAAMDLTVHAVEADEITASIATINLRHWDTATVTHSTAETTTCDPTWGVYLDPARRTATGRRVFSLTDYQPPWDFVLATTEHAPAAGIKVSPAIAHRDIPSDAEVQWVSIDGDVVEATIWRGATARPGIRRSAVILTDHGGAPAVTLDSSTPQQTPAPTGPIGTYLHEPDGAVIRAGMLDTVATEINGHLIDPTIAYLTTDTDTSSPATRRYRILDTMAFGIKRLRAYLAERHVGHVTIKKRGTAVTPEELRSKLRLTGDNHRTLVLTRVAGAHTILIVEPVQDHPRPPQSSHQR